MSTESSAQAEKRCSTPFIDDTLSGIDEEYEEFYLAEIVRPALYALWQARKSNPFSKVDAAPILFRSIDEEVAMCGLSGPCSVEEETPEDHSNYLCQRIAALLSDFASEYYLRYARDGSLDDIHMATYTIRLAIDIVPDSHPNKYVYYEELMTCLKSRFRRLNEVVDIGDAYLAEQRALDLKNYDEDDAHDHASVYFGLFGNTSSFERNLQITQNAFEMEQTIAVRRQAVDRTPDGHPHKPKLMDNLAVVLQARFERLGDRYDIDEAVAVLRRALELTDRSDSEAASRLNLLGTSLLSRFKKHRRSTDAHDAVTAHHLAANLTSDTSVDKSARLNDLGISLRFSSEIDHSVTVLYRTIDLTSNGHPDMPLRLNNLGDALEDQFHGTNGELSHIEHAIAVKRQAVELTPYADPDLPLYLNSLANTLILLFIELADRRSQSAHLGGSRSSSGIGLKLESAFKELNSCGLEVDDPSTFGHIGFASPLSDYSAYISNSDGPETLDSLISRFKRLSDIVNIRRAITAHSLNTSESLKLSLWNLLRGDSASTSAETSGFLARRFGTLEDIVTEESASTLEDIPASTNIDSPAHFDLAFHDELADVARSLAYRHERLSAFESFKLSLQQYTPPLSDNFPPSPFCIYSEELIAQLTGKDAATETINELLRVYDHALSAMASAASHGRVVERRYNALMSLNGVASAAASCAISIGRFVLAADWLEAGRGVVWGQLLQLRARTEELRAQHPHLADALEEAARGLEEVGNHTFIPPRFDSTSSTPAADRAAVFPRLRAGGRYNTVVAEIRRMPGFDRFLLRRSLSDLFPNPRCSPIAIINVHPMRCDALLVFSAERIVHIPLLKLSYSLAEAMRSNLAATLSRSNLRDRGAVSNLSKSSGTGDADLAWILECLWVLAVEPVVLALENQVETCKSSAHRLPRVTWCATGPLASLPLHAAGIYSSTQSFSDKPNKAFKRVISSYTPTLSALSPQIRSTIRTPLDSSTRADILVVSQSETDGLSPLPGTVIEVESIRARFTNGRIVSIEGVDATVASVLTAIEVHRPRIIHFACHGVQDQQHPTNSAFILQDGPLPLSALMTKSVDGAELAFLSACQTATGDATLSEEAVHLAAGMLAFGFKSVIGTLWSVGDYDAPLVADEVYARIAGRSSDAAATEESTAYALHEAADRLRDKIGEHNLVRWTPFVHFGA